MILGKITRKNGQTWATIYPEGEKWITLHFKNKEIETIEAKGNTVIVGMEK